MQIRLNQRVLSEATWRQIFQGLSFVNQEVFTEFSVAIRKLEVLRSQSQYNTGSISAFGALALFALSAMVKPGVIAEVGTFIGRSAISLSLGSIASGAARVECHTCDFSNHFELPKYEGIKLVQYMSKTSTQMFESLAAEGKEPTLFHIDGRLSDEDLKFLSCLGYQKGVFVLDDFEGIEKGVSNAFMLNKLLSKSHILIYPPRQDWTFGWGLNHFSGEASCALYVPRSHFSITAQ